ncbi:MAG: single-stranded DNA-binding protein [Candidatus Kerfeldbacteria bacterium]|nr:single-stranded DNA-binding protein [Candidatus Kerfeldbacteria bacterium]
MDLNKVMLIGRLTKDPEVRTIPSGEMVATFSLATGRQWTDKATGQKKSQTEFHNIVAWRRLADIVSQYCKKGQQIYIEGHLQTRSWDDPSGQKKYRTEIVTDNLILLGSRQGGTSSNSATAAQDEHSMPVPEAQGEETISVEDIPF